MCIVFRKANITDCSSLYECNKKCLPLFYSTTEYIYYTLSPFHDIFVVVESDTNSLIAYILGSMKNNNYHIMSIGVNDDYRKMGYGTKLLAYAKDNTEFCKSLSLYVHVENGVAIAFYKKNRFKIIKEMKNYYGEALGPDKSPNAYLMANMFESV